MDTLISKSTFYDTVSMIIPGFVLLYAFVVIFGIDRTIFYDCGSLVIPRYICISVVSYIVGLFIHHISRLVMDGCLRNNPDYILDAEEKFSDEIKVRRLKEKKTKNDKEAGILHDYYIKYYKVVPSTSIPVMEAQVSFLRSMVLVILLICFMIVIRGPKAVNNLPCARCCIVGILILFDALLYWMMFYIQDKIYYRVIEDDHYMDIVKGKKPPLDGADNKSKEEDAANKVKDENNIDKQTNKKQ